MKAMPMSSNINHYNCFHCLKSRLEESKNYLHHQISTSLCLPGHDIAYTNQNPKGLKTFCSLTYRFRLWWECRPRRTPMSVAWTVRPDRMPGEISIGRGWSRCTWKESRREPSSRPRGKGWPRTCGALGTIACLPSTPIWRLCCRWRTWRPSGCTDIWGTSATNGLRARGLRSKRSAKRKSPGNRYTDATGPVVYRWWWSGCKPPSRWTWCQLRKVMTDPREGSLYLCCETNMNQWWLTFVGNKPILCLEYELCSRNRFRLRLNIRFETLFI